MRMSKIVSVLLFTGAAVFLAYMLITGQVSIAWERIIICALVGGGISLVGRSRAEKLKRQDEEKLRNNPAGELQGDTLWKSVNPRAAEGASGDTAGVQTPDPGVVRMNVDARGIIKVLLIFIWLVILVCMAAAAADGAFSDMDAGTLGSFLALIAVTAVFTLFFIWFLNNFCYELYYTVNGVTVKKGKKEQHFSWSEIGSYTQRNYLYIFRDREGKRLFSSNSSYEGFDRFFDQYLRSRGGY